MHFNSSQSRSAWTEQEDDLLRNAVGIYGERSWANVAQMVPGRSSKSCSDRWRNFLSPDIEHPRKSPFTEWEIAVVVLAQARYGNNWKAISMLLPGRTNRAVKNLFVGNLKWGARLPEIRNRFLEWGMTLEALLEIKPDRAGGPVKPRPGQLLPDGTNGTSQDDSPLSGSPASTSSAGSAWQSDMTEHPNGSPGSANTSERRRRAEGDMVAQAGQQSSPVTKRRRGAQSPVLGGLQQQLQSPSLAPHPGALGPSFNGVSGGTGSPSLGLAIPGTMGPPANRNPSQYVSMDPSHSLLMPKHPAGSSNGSNDGTSALILPPGSESTPTSDLTGSEGCATLTPGGALTAGLAGGCFGAGAAAMGLMQQPGGPRTNSLPCGGLQQLLMGGDGGMASRVASWHYPGQMFTAGGAIFDPATAAAMAAARPASPFQTHPVQVSAVAAANIPGSLTSLLTDGSDMGAVTGAMGANGASHVKAECAAGAAASYQMHQQHQQHQHWLHQQHYHHHQQQQQHVQHHQHLQQRQQHQQHQQMAGMQSAHDQAAAAAAAAEMVAMQPHHHQQHHHHQQQQQQQLHRHGQGATTASIVASAAMELALPGSPVLAGNILQDMRSNDSAGLHSMLDQILNEDLNMADSTLALLGGSTGGSDGMPIAPQRSSAFDPPVITLPSLPEALQSCHAGSAPSPSPRPNAPPPTPQGGVGTGVTMGLLGQAGTSSSGQMAGMQQQHPWGGDFLGGGNMQAAAMQGGGQCGHNSSSSAAAAGAAAGSLGIKSEPVMQANSHGQLMHRAGSMGVPTAAQEPQQQQQHPQQQQQQMPSRPGSSNGMAAQAAAMQAQSPEPQGLPPNMSMLCAQLQQENMLLMHKLQQMETQMAGKPGQPDAAAQPPAAAAAAAAAAASAEQSMARSVSPLPAHVQQQQQHQQPAPSASDAWSGFDALMPQLRPVLTRVGGSAGGVLSVGGSLGGMCPSSDLVAESPAQLINTAFLDDHGLLGSL